MDFRRSLALSALSAVLVSLAACSSSGGGGSSTSTVDGVIATGEANATAEYSAELATPADMSTPETANAAIAFAAQLPSSMTDTFSLDNLGTSSSTTPTGVMTSVSTLTGATETATEPCDYSGSITGTNSVADPNTSTAGDYYVVTFSQCYFDPSFGMNGQMGARVNSFSGTQPYPYQLGMDIGIVNFSMNMTNYDGSTMQFSMNGGYNVSLSEQSDLSSAATIQGKAFAIDMTTSSGTSNFDLLFSNFRQSYSDDSAGAVTYSNDMTVTSHSFEAYITVDTTTPFHIPETCLGVGPETGEMVIYGANGRKARIVAGPACGNATVFYDLDGNPATPETEYPTTWSSLSTPSAP